MTHVNIVGVGYTNASQLLGDANRVAATAASGLHVALADGGAMAGDSSFADEFAAAYDEGAATVLDALVDAVDGLASLCRVAYCSLENHYRAELSSIASSTTFTTEPDVMGHDLYTAVALKPPSSLGGDASFLPDWANVILDHVEGFVWPDADVDRLRSIADAWRTAADQVDWAVDLTGDAICELWEERSPEIPLATDAVGELRDGLRELVTACEQIGIVCDNYASAVEAQRELILDLVSDLIRDAVLIQAAGFVLGFVTAGSTNAIALWINSGKLAAQVPRFKAFVEAVRMAGAGAAATMRTGTEAVVRAHATFRRMVAARMLVSGFERGAVSLVKDVTWLGRHEGGPMKAHTLARHVGKSDRFLRRRLINEPTRIEVSTFTDEAVAERSLRSILTSKSDEITSWLSSGQAKKRFDEIMPEDIGRIMDRAGNVRAGRGVRVILVKDASMPDGFRILTSMVQ